MSAGNLSIYDVVVSAVCWAFTFWMVADSFRRRASFWWVVVILLVTPPFGGLIYLAYVTWAGRRSAGALGDRPGTFTSSRAEGGDAEMLDVADRLEQQQRYREASLIYGRALERQDGDPRALHGLARCLIELGQIDEAVERYEALMAVDPRYRNYTAALEYAEALQRAGRGAESAELLEGLVRETGRLNHRLALAHYCEEAGQTARAKAVLSEALAAYEQSPEPEQQANRHWQRRIASKLEELAAG